jgi:hypothetical protein
VYLLPARINAMLEGIHHCLDSVSFVPHRVYCVWVAQTRLGHLATPAVALLTMNSAITLHLNNGTTAVIYTQHTMNYQTDKTST